MSVKYISLCNIVACFVYILAGQRNMSVLKLDEENELCAQVKQLVVGFTSHITDVESIDEAQNTYLHMEEYDRDFDRYELVKSLRASIEDTVGSLIDSEIGRHAPAPGHSLAEQESLINDITNRVLHSRNYSELLRRVRDKLERTSEYLLANFDHEFQPYSDGSAATSGLDSSGYRIEKFYSDVEAESSIDDSLNQSAVMFMNVDRQRRIADGLNRSNGIDMRRSAIKELLQVTSIDVQNCDAWPIIRVGIRDALLDDDDSLWPFSLRFIARGLSTNCHEIYQVLVEYLEAQFGPGYVPPVPFVREGLDITKLRIGKVFKAFRLLNSFLQLASHYSQRYQEGTLNSILEPTFSFLDVNRPMMTAGRFLPMHFLALVDYKAVWITNLMHSQFSRSCLLKVLEAHPGLVECAVRSCLNYVSVYVESTPDSSSRNGDSNTWQSDGAHYHYTGREMEYAHFLHSLRFVGRLILYDRGRRFFPIGESETGPEVTITQIVVAIVYLTTHLPKSYKPDTAVLDPHQLSVDILKKLCSSEDACQKVVCNNAVTGAILEPITRFVNKSQGKWMATEMVVSNVAAILSAVASTRCGHQHLLYGENCDWRTSTKESRIVAPVNVIVKFTLMAIAADDNSDDLSRDVVSDMLSICRLLYHTCEGLLVIGDYGLHSHLASAWQDAKRVVDNVTPTPMSGSAVIRKEFLWEQQLRDDLLNFAWTPKGVLLLQQTGAFCDSVSLMYSRYERKLQVSSCEKFGYGYMMSQVAATAAGILVLDQVGFTRALIRMLWATVEVVDDGPPGVPKCWPVSPIDKLAKKPFANIVNLLSSFLSVYEILEHDRCNPQNPEDSVNSSRRVPETISDLLDKLVFINSVDKMKSLFNYEQSHVFGLRLLSILTSCLDTMLLLQQKYSFQELLLRCQSENVVDESRGIVLDMLSLERNYILVKTYLIGGPTERRLPQRNIEYKNAAVDYPLFSSYPIPNEYIVKASDPKHSKEEKSELTKFLSTSKKSGMRQLWVEQAQSLLTSELMSGTNVDSRVLFDLLEKVVGAKVENSLDTCFPQIKLSDSASNKTPLSIAQQLGISLVVRYGCQLNLLSSEKDGTDKLSRVIRKFEASYQQHSVVVNETGLACLTNHTKVGFDWFAGTLFLMASGNTDRTEKFLSKFSSLLTAGYVWTKRLHGSADMRRDLVNTGIPPTCFVACHHIEHILQLELPHVYSVFKMSGYSPAQICQHWLRQCFWNYLDWPQICEYISLCITCGPDYSVYMCVAVLHYLQSDLMRHMQNKNLIVFLKEEPIRYFRVGSSLDYMQRLQSKFRDVVLADMRSIV